jgi:hypothetical protein
MKEQLKAVKDIRSGTGNITKQIKLITTANLGNSRSAVTILDKIKGVQEISKQNAAEAKNIRGILGKHRAARPSAKNRKDEK